MGHGHGEFGGTHVNTSPVDTKSKTLLTTVLILTLLVSITYEQLLVFAAYGTVLARRMKVRVLPLLKKTLIPLPLILSLSLLSFVSSPNGMTLEFSEVSIAYNRWEVSLFFFLRSMLLVGYSLMLIESEPSFFEVIYALEELRMPPLMVNVLLFMYRTALDLEQEARRMIDARYSRSPYKRWNTSLYTYRVLAYMVAGIFVRAFSRREVRRDALISRGFNGRLYHRRIMFSFHGLLTLWLSIIFSLMILLASSMSFLRIGVITVGGT